MLRAEDVDVIKRVIESSVTILGGEFGPAKAHFDTSASALVDLLLRHGITTTLDKTTGEVSFSELKHLKDYRV